MTLTTTPSARGAPAALDLMDFEHFVAREHRRLVRALTLYCGDQGLAEQLAQDALVRARERWSTVSAMHTPGAWLYRVALNLSNSWWRRCAAERRAYQRARVREDAEVPDPADTLAVRAALARLPRRQREVLILRYFLDLPVDETAARMGCTPGTVKSFTHRAIASLRTQLVDVDEPLEEPRHA